MASGGRRAGGAGAFIAPAARALGASLLLALLAAGCGASSGPASAPGAGERALFDGRTLAGWEGDPAFFRVEEGAIVGGRRGLPTPRNEFLCTTADYGDFALRLRFRVDAGINSGVQIRTRRIPGSHEVIGYQADLGDGYWGAIYDESRRNRVLAAPDSAALAARLDRTGWNDYEIVARGRRVRLAINGLRTVDYTEPDASLEQTGRICLQIHSGPPGEARFRDLRIEPLTPS